MFATTLYAQKKAPTVKNNQLPIGVFDSGTGGLTVLEAILQLDAFNNQTGLPQPDGKPDFEGEYFQYLADQANMPYGNYAAEGKTELLKEHILKNISFLNGNTFAQCTTDNRFVTSTKQPVKMIVIACNTATAYALTEVQQYLQKKADKVPCIGVIDAGARAALAYQQQHKGTIGIFATAGTVASNGYPKTLNAMAQAYGLTNLSVVSQSGVGLAESIDRDWSYFADTVGAFRKKSVYKGPAVSNSVLTIDTLLLAAYNFSKKDNQLLCEWDNTGRCLDIQLNHPTNYVKYHLVSLLEKMLATGNSLPLNTLVLGCTHYPFMKDTITSVLKYLYNYEVKGTYRYRKVLAAQVMLIDPAVETAKQAYQTLRLQHLQTAKGNTPTGSSSFYISVPNTQIAEVQLQKDGWFTYAYKYGRTAGKPLQYVQYVPFSRSNIAPATYERIQIALPKVHRLIQSNR